MIHPARRLSAGTDVNLRGFAVIEIFLVAFMMTALAFLFSANRGSDQNIQVAKADNAVVDNTGKQPAQFKAWIEKKEAR
jgi:hypothetical protein